MDQIHGYTLYTCDTSTRSCGFGSHVPCVATTTAMKVTRGSLSREPGGGGRLLRVCIMFSDSVIHGVDDFLFYIEWHQLLNIEYTLRITCANKH